MPPSESLSQPASRAPERQASAHEHAAAARARKRADAQAIGIDDDYISDLVDRFYDRVRDDPALGPIFAGKVTDWPVHLGLMKLFWRSVLHNSGEYSGNPMLKHLAVPGLAREHFALWLDLFRRTLVEIEPDSRATELVHERARMIANSLLNGIAVHRDGMVGARPADAV